MNALAQKLEIDDTAAAHLVSALALVETFTAAQVFSESGLDSIIERIEQETRTTALDISTPKGRKEIASLAAKIAKSKTALDKMGKELVSGWKEQAKKVDVERSRAWDRLEALQKEIRQPLTEWENREKDRITQREADLAEIVNSGTYTTANWQSLSVEVMNDRLKELLTDKTDWQEFSVRAKQALETATEAVAAAILKRQTHDAEQAELARLRKEEEERKQREHEETIARAAAEQARLLAEEEAQKAAMAEAARVAAEKAKAEAERQRIQREKEDADARAKKAEGEKHAAIERAARERLAAEENAKRQKAEADARAAQTEKNRIAAEAKTKEDARIAAERAAADKKAAEEAAAKRERDRIAAEKKAEANAQAKREADKAHRARINREAMQRLMDVVSPHSTVDPTATSVLVKVVIEAVAKGQIPHIKISY